ncbi:MAG: hypothetical protein JSV37_00895 [Anaerolineaceae bacterium]|nr:MAG: hypothetical protein JSV37_00895 [Anaerolineaceae bacterium]
MSPASVRYSFDEAHRLIIENYNWSKAFSSFLPGIAGLRGIPIWCYYVNRGQAICSLGKHDKDGAILEFLSFNRALQMVGRQGFRTFLRMNAGSIYEPFIKTKDPNILQRLIISAHEIELFEQDSRNEVEIVVLYYPLVNLPVAGLVRQVTIKNLGQTTREFEVLDGLPRVIPHGVTFEHLKVIARHIEAMMIVNESKGVPIFRLKQTAEDIEQVGDIQGGNFYLSGAPKAEISEVKYIVDPAVIYGEPHEIEFPWLLSEVPMEEILTQKQVRENQTPCAFTALTETLSPGEALQFYSVVGYTPNSDRLDRFVQLLDGDQFLHQNRVQNHDLIEQIQNMAFTVSSEPQFDRYCQHTFLDNVIRGGMPTFLGDEDKQSIFYSYIRQGGDLERDYHWFTLEPTYLSQGNGHYRNICQNRRMDTWFFPKVEDHNIRLFMNLIQLDGYNPLVINGQTYSVRSMAEVRDFLSSTLGDDAPIKELMTLVSEPFTPGVFMMWLEELYPDRKIDLEQIVGGLLWLCKPNEVGALHEGFWIDHWSYNLDLIDSFLMIYPQRLRELLLENRGYSFFDNPDVVLPRAEKSLLVEGRVRQYGAVMRDPEKVALISKRDQDQYKIRTQTGEVYQTTLLVKLLCILTNKLAVLDPQGIGVEMEAGKPGWCDSLNGLPGLFGSSICQTLELVRAFRFLLMSISDLENDEGFLVYEELAVLITGLNRALDEHLHHSASGRLHDLWDRFHTSLEHYRAQTRLGIDGEERMMAFTDLTTFLETALDFLEAIFSDDPREKIFHPNGVPYTYYRNEVIEYEPVEDLSGEHPDRGFTRPTAFRQEPLALFLEGPVHYLKVYPEQAQRIYDRVRQSELFDETLQMFKCSASLADQPDELGRIMAYGPGWIENEAIYTHMAYKWLLELLRSGCFEAFYREMRNGLPPFLSPEVYGRSTLENSSFIVSTSNPDENLHGQSFQPRLSGVTAEMLQIWTMMVAGKQPFILNEHGEMNLCLQPSLPAWLFTEKPSVRDYWDRDKGWQQVQVDENCFAFRFLGQTLVIYHNPSRKATSGADGVAVERGTFQYRDGHIETLAGPCFGVEITNDVRRRLIYRIDIDLA